MGLTLARMPVPAKDETAVAPERTPPLVKVFVAFHPPRLLVYGKPVPTEAVTKWLLEDDEALKVSVNVSCAVIYSVDRSVRVLVASSEVNALAAIGMTVIDLVKYTYDSDGAGV